MAKSQFATLLYLIKQYKGQQASEGVCFIIKHGKKHPFCFLNKLQYPDLLQVVIYSVLSMTASQIFYQIISISHNKFLIQTEMWSLFLKRE